MLVAANPLAKFINDNPTVVMLALGFLIMIGMTLIAEGFGAHVPKGYIYAAMAFSAAIEVLNMMSRRRQQRALADKPCLQAVKSRPGSTPGRLFCFLWRSEEPRVGKTVI